MRTLRTLCGLGLAIALAAPPAAAISLYDPTSPYANLYMTSRPKKVGDIITIIIDERSSAEETADIDIEKETEIDSSVDGINSFNPFGKAYPLSPLFRFDADNNYEAEAKNERTNRVSAQLAATVVRVMDNGNLLLEGRREIFVGKDKKSIIVTGVVRPEDVRPDNSVLSSVVADAEIRYEGMGPVNDSNRRPLITRLIDLLPFF